MSSFEVKDMTCGHCVATITKAVKAADPDATVQIDLPSHRVNIDSRAADDEALAAAISEAGYTPVAVNAALASPPAAGAGRGGCCCK